jgi:hypothetical protein
MDLFPSSSDVGDTYSVAISYKEQTSITGSDILYFSILLHSFNTEYLFFIISDDGRVRPKHVLIELKK